MVTFTVTRELLCSPFSANVLDSAIPANGGGKEVTAQLCEWNSALKP